MAIRLTETQKLVVNKRQIVVLLKYTEVNPDNRVAARIANNTAQTWQQNRGQRETLANTIQGKIAEELFQLYLAQNHRGINLMSYDEIRNDGFMKHAPFDFLSWSGELNIANTVNSIRNDITASSDRFVRLSANSRNLCHRENVKIIEIKSTKITDRHKRQCSFFQGDYNDHEKVTNLSRVILNDDFLAYPHFCRSTAKNDFSVNDYINLLQSKRINVNNEEEMRSFEITQQLADVFVRVYVDEAEHAGLLIGWTDKKNFYQNAVIKKMPQYGKSELALYFAASLRTGYILDCFPALFYK